MGKCETSPTLSSIRTSCITGDADLLDSLQSTEVGVEPALRLGFEPDLPVQPGNFAQPSVEKSSIASAVYDALVTLGKRIELAAWRLAWSVGYLRVIR